MEEHISTPRGEHEVTIELNGRPVVMEGKEASGLQIKEAAVRQAEHRPRGEIQLCVPLREARR